MGESREISGVMEEEQWKTSTHGGGICPTLPVEGREGERGEREGERVEGERGRGEGGGEGGEEGWLEAPVTAQRRGSPRREVWGDNPAAGLLQEVGSKAAGRRGDASWEALQGRD